MKEIQFSIERDFSPCPVGKYSSDGEFSGENLTNKYLLPRLGNALYYNSTLVIILDNESGYSYSFLDGVFTTLMTQTNFSVLDILRTVELRFTKDNEEYIKQVQQIVYEAISLRELAKLKVRVYENYHK